MLGTRVTGAQARGGPGGAQTDHVLLTTRGTLRARWVVNAAGLHSDRVDTMLGGDGGFTIRPRRGELIVFDKLARPLICSMLLTVPTAPSEGVVVGPNL